MSKIKVDFNWMRTTSENDVKIVNRMMGDLDQLKALYKALDWEVKSKNAIDQDMERGLKKIQSQMDTLMQMGLFLKTAADEFEKCENRIIESLESEGKDPWSQIWGDVQQWDFGGAVNHASNGMGNWLNSTEPLAPFKIQNTDASIIYGINAGMTALRMPFSIPTENGVVSKSLAAFASNLAGFRAEITKDLTAMIDPYTGTVRPLSSGDVIKVKPYKNWGKVCTWITVASAGADIGNTWTEDSGNTNLKRIEKTVIQSVGVGVAYGVGKYVTTPILEQAVKAAPDAPPLSVVFASSAVALDIASAVLIDGIQNHIYNILDIK